MRSSDALISPVVLLSRNVKTAHSLYYKDLREIIFLVRCRDEDASYVRFGETKDKYLSRSLRHGTEMRHRNLRSDSVLVYTGYIGAIL